MFEAITIATNLPQTITIADITVKQDAEGRFCLNDFHKAADGVRKNQPSNWLRLDETTALIQLLTSEDLEPIASWSGRYGGTYVCKELVYAYAMWISPKFHLHVIRTYDQIVQKQLEEAQAIAQQAMQRMIQAEKKAAVVSDQLEYMTVQQYRAMTGVCWSRKHHNAIGTFLTNMCKQKGLEVRRFNQNGFPSNSYPVSVIEELADQIGYYPQRQVALS